LSNYEELELEVLAGVRITTQVILDKCDGFFNKTGVVLGAPMSAPMVAKDTSTGGTFPKETNVLLRIQRSKHITDVNLLQIS
jgi:hypothetical protein